MNQQASNTNNNKRQALFIGIHPDSDIGHTVATMIFRLLGRNTLIPFTPHHIHLAQNLLLQALKEIEDEKSHSGQAGANITLSDLINKDVLIEVERIGLRPNITQSGDGIFKVSCALLLCAINDHTFRDLLKNTPDLAKASQEAYEHNPETFKRLCFQILASNNPNFSKCIEFNLDAMNIFLETLFNNADLSHDNLFKQSIMLMGKSRFFQLDKKFSLSKNNPDFFKVTTFDEHGSQEEFLPALAIIRDPYDNSAFTNTPGKHLAHSLWENVPQETWLPSKGDTASDTKRKTFFFTSILTQLFAQSREYYETNQAISYYLGVKGGVSKADPYYITKNLRCGPLLFGDYLISQGGYNRFGQMVSTETKLKQYLHHPQTNLLARFFLYNNHDPSSKSHFRNAKTKFAKGQQLLKEIITIEKKHPSPSNLFDDFIRSWIGTIRDKHWEKGRVYFDFPIDGLFSTTDTPSSNTTTDTEKSTAAIRVLEFYDRIGADLLAPSQLIKELQKHKDPTEPYSDGCLLADFLFITSTLVLENSSLSFQEPDGFLLKKLNSLTQKELDFVFDSLINLIKATNNPPNLAAIQCFVRVPPLEEERPRRHPLLVALICFKKAGASSFSEKINSLNLEQSLLISQQFYQHQFPELNRHVLMAELSPIEQSKKQKTKMSNKL